MLAPKGVNETETTTMTIQLSLSSFEALDGAMNALLYLGDFETCADPRGYIRASNRLYDACLDAGMSREEPDHEKWACVRICKALTSSSMVSA